MKTSGNKRILRWIINNVVWIILVVIVLIFSVTIDGFVSVRNYINIVYHSVFIGILAIAVSYCLISDNLDLSVESVAGFGAILQRLAVRQLHLCFRLSYKPLFGSVSCDGDRCGGGGDQRLFYPQAQY